MSTPTDVNATPENTMGQEYAQAAAALQEAVRKDPALSSLEVQVSKGFRGGNWKPDASKDILQITVRSPALTSSDTADAANRTMLSALNQIDAVRNEVILVSPREYLEQVKSRLGKLQAEARKEGIPGSEYDYTQSTILSPDYSGSQIPDYGTQLVEGPTMTQIRINIPTNPDNREEAMARAEKVAENLRNRLDDIKKGMIKHLVRKNYIPNLTDEGKKQLEAHQFEVATQQQANWTSVFINISSPEQQAAQQNPGAERDPNLQKTNMLSQVDEKSRFKLASRAVLYEGENLKTPSKIFDDVAGSMDMENAVGKLMHHLSKKRPDLIPEINALMKENVFKRREQWNLPPEKQEEFKRSVSGYIDPDEPDVMKFKLILPKGKADEIIKQIAAAQPAQETGQPQQEAAAAPIEQQPPAPPMPPADETPPLQAYQPAAEEAQAVSDGDPYRQIARDIINLHKARMEKSWQDNVRSEQEQQTPGGRGAA